MKIVQVLPDRDWAGASMRRGYGLAWRRPEMPASVCLPVPLNLLARWGRALWFVVLHGLRPDHAQREFMEGWGQAYRKGFEAGSRKGTDVGLRAGWADRQRQLEMNLDRELSELRRRSA